MISRYDDIFQEILYEGQNENRADSIVKKSYKDFVKGLDDEEEEEMLLGTIEEEYEKLKEGIQEIGIGYPESKNMRHLPQLVRYFIESRYNSVEIIELYRRYLQSPLRSKDLIMSIDSLEEFKSEIEYIEEITPSSEVIDDSEDIVYEDSDIVVRYGKDKKSCIALGKDTRYGFCISRSGSSNLFLGYRLKGASFYFIEFKNEESKGTHPEIETLVIHVYPDDRYMATFGVPGEVNSDFQTTPSDLIKKFPALREAFSSGIFKEVPPSADEQNLLDIQEKIDSGTYDITDFSRPRDKILYIQLGGVIEYPDAERLRKEDPSRYKDYIDTYIENNTFDIDDRLLDSELMTPKQKKRYKEKLQQRVDIKLSQDIHLTNHERTYALDHIDLSKVPDKVKYNILKSHPLGTTKEDIRTSLQYIYDVYDNKRYFLWQLLSILQTPNVLEESVIKEEEDWIRDVLMRYAETVYTKGSEEPLYSAWIGFRDTDVSFYNVLKLLRVGLASIAYEAIYKGQEIDFLDEFELSSRPDLYNANELILLLRWTDNTTQIAPEEVEDTIIEFSKIHTTDDGKMNIELILNPDTLDFNFIKFSPFLSNKLRDIVIYNDKLSESRKKDLIEILDTYSEKDYEDIEEPGPRQRSLTESLIRKTIEIYWNTP